VDNGKITWKTEKRSLTALKPSPYNPRQITKKQKKDLQKSLENFNLADPLIINTDGTIIGGHQRYEILKEKGIFIRFYIADKNALKDIPKDKIIHIAHQEQHTVYLALFSQDAEDRLDLREVQPPSWTSPILRPELIRLKLN